MRDFIENVTVVAPRPFRRVAIVGKNVNAWINQYGSWRGLPKQTETPPPVIQSIPSWLCARYELQVLARFAAASNVVTVLWLPYVLATAAVVAAIVKAVGD